MKNKINVRKFSRNKIDTLPIISEEPEYQQINEQIISNNYEEVTDEYTDDLPTDEDFLNDLNSDVFVSQTVIEKTEKERKKEEKEREAQERKYEREQKKLEKYRNDLEKKSKSSEKYQQSKEDDELFSERGTQLYGRDKLELIARINQYKVLFPENKQLKALKIKKNPSVEDLHSYLAECQAIIDTDCVEAFATESILQAIKMVEIGSTRTKYNIKGLADALKRNPQFTILCKQMYLKYKVFASIPPELQLGMLIISTAYVIMEKNKREATNEDILNKTIDPTLLI